METHTINWLDLSEPQKAEVLAQTRTYLSQQVAEAKISASVMAVLDKHGLTKINEYSLSNVT